jgi:thioredoxin 1
MKTALMAIAALVIAGFAYMSYRGSHADFAHDTKGGIQFHRGTFSEALARAKKENKLVFLDIYAEWCGPCKRLKSVTFADEGVGTFYNSNFVNVALNGEEGEGADLAAKFAIRSYPSLLFINSSGEVVKATSGFKNEAGLIALGKGMINN